MKPEPIASAIVVCWNGRGYIAGCLDSLVSQTLASLEILVVDNASTDGSADFVEERYGERVTVRRNGRNTGFGEGNNIGIRAARGRYVLLLNADAVAEATWAEELVGAAQEGAAERVGMCAGKVLMTERPGVLESTGHLLYADGLNQGRGKGEPDLGQFDSMREALYPSGAAALYRRDMLEEIGLFDERFFAYGDDTDVGLRGRLAGWRCLYVPRAVARHRGGAAASPHSSFKVFHVERNRVWVAVKCFPAWLAALNLLFALPRWALHLAAALTRRGAAGRFRGERSLAALFLVTLRAQAAALAGLPGMFEARREVERFRRVPRGEVLRWLREYGVGAWKLALEQ